VSGEPDDSAAPEDSEAPVDTSVLTGLNFARSRDSDFTLKVGESYSIALAFQPEDWSGDVTWTSSDDSVATVDANGTVTNVNDTKNLHRVIITATAEDFSVSATVYCRPAETVEASAEPSTAPSDTTTSSGSLTAGATGTITGASGGLRVRSGPGTSYEVLASLTNGSEVTVVSDAGDGWYQIQFSGSGGSTTTGYIMGEYISVP
jgi:hypothetical protein